MLISVSKTVYDEHLTALNTVYYYLLIPPLKLVKAVTCLASSMLNSKISKTTRNPFPGSTKSYQSTDAIPISESHFHFFMKWKPFWLLSPRSNYSLVSLSSRRGNFHLLIEVQYTSSTC